MFNSKIKKLIKIIFFSCLIAAWVFSGWPQIWRNPPFPLQPEKAQAGTATYTIGDGSLTAAVVSGACDSSLTNTTASDGAQGTVITSTCVGKHDNPVVKWTKTLTWEAMGVPAGAMVTQVDGSFKYRAVQETHAATQTIGTMTLRNSGDTAACAASDLEANFDPGGVSGSYSTRNLVSAVAVSSGCMTSNTSVTIRLAVNPRTGNNNSATSELRADDISLAITYNVPPTLVVSQPDGTDDTVTAGDSYNITYTLFDPDDVVTVAFYYDTNNSGLDGTAISGACATAAAGTDATCAWDTTGVTPGSYYVYGITDDGTNPAVSAYSPGQITINSAASGAFNVYASSTQSFDASLTVVFTSQTATMSDVGAIKVEDDRGSGAGWTLNLSANDWKTDTGAAQMDHAGGGSDDNRGKLCASPAVGTLYAESGSLTNVNQGTLDCFGSTVSSVDVVTADSGFGAGVYWLTEMSLSQFIPANPTAAVYTTTIILTLQ